MPNPLSDLTQQLLDYATRAGADQADAIAVDGTSISIDVRCGALEHADRSEGIDVGLRVIIGQRQACVSSSDIKPDTLREMADRAISMAKEAPKDPYAGLADPSQLAAMTDNYTLELYDPSEEPDPAKLQTDASRAEAAALQNKGISQVQSASAGYSHNRIHMSASNGFSAGYSRTSRGLSCVAISGTGADMERDYDYDSRIFGTDLRDATEIGIRAAARAVERSGARKPKTGAYPVLFDERISSTLISQLLQATSGAAIARGSSWLRHAMGEQVLPKGLSIIEDPHRVRTASSRMFDAEGLPTASRAIVKDGILMGWTLDLANARKLGMNSTGNAVRGTSAPPSPSISNVSLTQGTANRDDLIAQMGTGLLVTSMIGSTINPNTGDYSRGASGFWIENGQITYAINECTVAGNLRDMLMRITPANDAQPHLSTVVPSLLVEGLTLAGD